MIRACLTFCVIILFSVSISSKSYNFLRLNNSDGLSNNQVELIFKDSRGFMWFVTNSGLNRYDGQNFKIYRTDKKNSEGLISDDIESIQEDSSGLLWFHYFDTKYDLFDIHTEKFIHNVDSVLLGYGLPEKAQFVKIYNKSKLYAFYANNEIYCCDLVSQKTKKIERDNYHKQTIHNVEISEKHIWILYKDGFIERLNKQTGLIDFENDYFQKQANSSTIIKTIKIDADEDLWIYPGVSDKGIAYFNMKNNQWTFWDKELSNNFVRCVVQDNSGLFWIGTDHGGVNIYDKVLDKIVTVLTNNLYEDSSISQNSIISAFCSDDGTVWIGTYKNGVSYYHPHVSKFDKPDLYYQFRHSAEIFDCNNFYKDEKDNLWIGLNGGGLIKYNEKTNQKETFKHNPNNPQSLSSDIVTSITEDHEGIVWIGTFLGGINAYDGNVFRRYQINQQDSNSISSRSVYGITEDKYNNLWIATLGGGVNCLDETRKYISRYNTTSTKNTSSDYILSIFKNEDGIIYFGSDRGPFYLENKVIKPIFNQTQLEDSLTNIKSNNLTTDRRGILWLATDNGINIYNPQTGYFQYINSKDGLPDEEIVSLIEDNFGNIWAGTRNGLVHIECFYKSNKLEYTLHYFDERDGLPSSVCNQNAIFKDKDGKIYVGTTKGYISFFPNKIKVNKVPPKPNFTDLFISGQVIVPNVKYKKRVIINHSITDLDEIELRYDETNFSISFSAMNYIHSEKSQYKYKLVGLDKKWIFTKKGEGVASYSNLNPGTYKLEVYASNEDGVWSEIPIVMTIKIHPPFWLSWWAYLCYVSIVVAIIWLVSKYRLNKQKKEFKQTQQILEIQKTHEVDELKFKFFTNISHEFKTPITLILAPLDKLLKDDIKEDQRKMLNLIKRNALNLLNLVNEILEFRKLDLNKADLNLTQNDIIEFTKEICNSFTTLATEKGINFSFTSYLNSLYLELDYEKMNKILSNLISNAFKYTEEGQIGVNIGILEDIKTSNKHIQITVSDTGMGIAKEYQTKIFDRFFRIDNKQKVSVTGTGVGLHLVSEYVKMHKGEITIDSEPGKGSVFIVRIPIITNIVVNKLSDPEDKHSLDLENELSEDDRVKINTINLSNKANLPLLMVVDDNEELRLLVSELFSDSYNIVMAEDGEEAFTLVMDQLPDIILCDVMMPKMDGYEFCKKIRSDMRTSHIPIILLSAKSSDENKYLGIEAGADDYISKPFNTDLLRLKMAKIIEKQKKIQQSFKQKIDISPSEIEITSMDEKFVKKAVEFVEQNMSNPEFLVEDLCKEMAMSRVYFYKKILALTGKTPSEFIRFIRLKRASELLQKSQLFVNEVAFQVGFNDPKYFRKYFKDEFGITPNEYKKQFI